MKADVSDSQSATALFNAAINALGDGVLLNHAGVVKLVSVVDANAAMFNNLYAFNLKTSPGWS